MRRFMRWWYHDSAGTPVFQHYRVSQRPTPDDPREKRYGYRVPTEIRDGVVQGWIEPWGKPAIADSLIYKLPLVLANPDARLLSCEGERDACAALDRGILASSHHGGGGKFTEAMAESLAGHRGRIVLVADNDVTGAADVCRRFDLLRAAGIPASRLRVREVVPTHRGADLRDHFAAGYGVRDLRRADLDQLREVASTSTGDPSEGSWGEDACTPEELEQIRNWRPTLVRTKTGARR